jgi:N6-adenosine-specific RNA methylase IME4
VHRNYVEKESPTSSKLYVTGITNEDAGRYSCELLINGAKLREKFFKLTIFSKQEHAFRTFWYTIGPTLDSFLVHKMFQVLCACQ